MPQCDISSLTPPHSAMMHDATTVGMMMMEQGTITMGQGIVIGWGIMMGWYDNGVGHNDGAGNDNETQPLPIYQCMHSSS
jgi:hypothetical protein